jgi:hypothetical protein
MALPAIIVGALAGGIVPLAVKLLTALGIGIVTYTGADFAVSQALAYFESQFSGLPSAVIQILYILGFHQGMSMVFAAWAASVAIQVAMGAFTRFRVSA